MTDDDSGDTRSVSKAEVCLAYKQTFATPEGQVVLADLMRRYSFTRRSTVQVEYGHDLTRYNEGQRMVLVHIGIQLDASPSSFEDNQEVEM